MMPKVILMLIFIYMEKVGAETEFRKIIQLFKNYSMQHCFIPFHSVGSFLVLWFYTFIYMVLNLVFKIILEGFESDKW